LSGAERERECKRIETGLLGDRDAGAVGRAAGTVKRLGEAEDGTGDEEVLLPEAEAVAVEKWLTAELSGTEEEVFAKMGFEFVSLGSGDASVWKEEVVFDAIIASTEVDEADEVALRVTGRVRVTEDDIVMVICEELEETTGKLEVDVTAGAGELNNDEVVTVARANEVVFGDVEVDANRVGELKISIPSVHGVS